MTFLKGINFTLRTSEFSLCTSNFVFPISYFLSIGNILV